jgi:hypothetical protein
LHVSLGQQRANLAEHPPSGFISDSGFALNLLCRNTATSRSHEIHGVVPEPQRRAAVLEDRPGHRRNLCKAFIATVHGATLDTMMLTVLFARFAVRNTARKTLFSEMLKAGIIGRKLTVEIIYRVS